ncbi:MAG: hypothetical protein H6537_03000 [Bacteroidales bacterium]|nr:hypothetical protein [Bacteroidales bacterium]
MYIHYTRSFISRNVRKSSNKAGHKLKLENFRSPHQLKFTAAGMREGFVKLIFDAKYGESLGAHMVGSNVTEMIEELVVARNLETSDTN